MGALGGGACDHAVDAERSEGESEDAKGSQHVAEDAELIHPVVNARVGGLKATDGEVGVEGGDGGVDRVDHDGGSDGGLGADGELKGSRWSLFYRLINAIGDGAGLRFDGLEVRHHADDLAPLRGRALEKGEAPADRVGVAEENSGGGLSDQEDAGRGGLVARQKGAAGEEAHGKGLKIAGADRVDHRRGFASAGGALAAFDEEFCGAGPIEKRHGRGEAGGFHAGERGEPLEGEPLEGGDFRRVGVGGGGQRDLASNDVGGLPAGASMAEFVETADEGGGAGEQDQSEGELGDDEELAKALVGWPAGAAATSAFQRVVEIEPQREERGRETKGEGGEAGGAEGPGEDLPIEGRSN